MTDDKKSAKDKVSDGIKQGIGVLSAFKEALEETINEARERGDLSTDRAKAVMKDALDKAHTAAEGAKEKLDLVHQKEFEGLRDAVDAVKERVSALEAHLKEDDTTEKAEGDGSAAAADEGESTDAQEGAEEFTTE
jgi:polyhydroxyalkanoate synthesis regulator phasin